jgi:hypothetical protein
VQGAREGEEQKERGEKRYIAKGEGKREKDEKKECETVYDNVKLLVFHNANVIARKFFSTFFSLSVLLLFFSLSSRYWKREKEVLMTMLRYRNSPMQQPNSQKFGRVSGKNRLHDRKHGSRSETEYSRQVAGYAFRIWKYCRYSTEQTDH